MLHEKVMDYEFWAEAVSTAVYLKNRSPTKALPKMTPEEAWSGSKPSVEHLRPFGCKAYTHIPIQKRSKLDSKTVECILVGYDGESKAYRLFDPVKRVVNVGRDVIFDERAYDERNEHTERASTNPSQNPTDKPDQNDLGKDQTEKSLVDLEDEHQGDLSAEDVDYKHTSGINSWEIQDEIQDALREISRATNRISNIRDVELRRSTRKSKQPERYACLAITEPRTYKEAIDRNDAKQWEKAMREEYDSIISNQTWSVVDLPPGRKAIGCRWVYRIKYTSTGEIDKYKARLVAKGYSQARGIDFDETFAPVVKFNSIRILLAFAAQYDLEIHQMDVKSAYLNGDLVEEIYMEQPEGFIDPTGKEKVCQLHKSLYGLKQAGRSWYHKIDAYFGELGLIRSFSDNCVYRKSKDGKILIIALYVDDLLIFSNEMAELQELKMQMCKRFEMTDLGEVRYCLGLEISRDRTNRTIKIGQARYVKEILERFNMGECKPVSTPTEGKLSNDMSPATAEERERMADIPYQNAVGSLMYAMLGTRPDIAFAVGAISWYSSNPGEAHWRAVKRVFRYLKGTSDYAIMYDGRSRKIEGFSDADWVGDQDERRSTTGYVFVINGGAVTWLSKRQQTVALSSTEAEYMALAHTAKEAIWIRRFLQEIYPNEAKCCLEINTDNQSSLALAKNPVHHARTKHIDIRHHFIREKIETKELDVSFCGTEDMVADVLTKGLSKEKHNRFISRMGLVDSTR